MLTDAWGPIPMTEALQGVANTTPAYDTQEQVYNGILTLIDDAMSSMDDGAGPQGDQVYGGDMMMWEKFANTLKPMTNKWLEGEQKEPHTATAGTTP